MGCIYIAVTNMLAYVFTSCWQIQDFTVSDNDMTKLSGADMTKKNKSCIDLFLSCVENHIHVLV